MYQPNTNITPKYRQEMHYNYVENSGFGVLYCSPLLCYRFATTTLTAQIPTETLSQSHRLCFIGKERDSETSFSYFGARYYDSDILTGWLSVDPMADKYPNLSPYAYCGWNPVKLVDPDGEEIEDPSYNGSGWGHNIRRFLYYRLGLSNNINNVVESGINSILQSNNVIVQGQALDKIKNDPKIIELENDIVEKAKSDENYGKKSFNYSASRAVQLGGDRAPGNMLDQLLDPFNPKYRDTWSVAFNELTWLVRSVLVKYDASVTKNYKKYQSYRF